MRAGGLALNLRLSSLEPALDEQERTDMIHSCLHSVMAVLPEPEGEDGSQEVSLRVPRRWPHPWGGRGKAAVGRGLTSGAGTSSPSSPCTRTPCMPLRTC